MPYLTVCQPDGGDPSTDNVSAICIHGVFPSFTEARTAVRALAPAQSDTRTYIIDDLNRCPGRFPFPFCKTK